MIPEPHLRSRAARDRTAAARRRPADAGANARGVLRLSLAAAVAAIVFVAGVSCSSERKPTLEDPPAAHSTLPPLALPIPTNIDDFHPKIAGPIREALAELRSNSDSAAAWQNLAVVYDAQHYYSLAERCYERAVELDATNVRSWYNLAFVRGELADMDGACAAMSRATRLNADYVPAHWRIGLWKLDLGDLDAAEVSFDKAAVLDADDSVSQICLARVNLQRQDWDRAVELLEPIARSDQPNARYARQLLAPAYRALGRREDATAAALGGIGRALSFDDPWRGEVDQARAYLYASLREANRLLADRRPKEAIALLDELREQQPKEVGLATEMAKSYRNAGRFDESVAILTDVLARHPSHYPAELALARTLAGMKGKAQEAVVHADRAIELNPTLAAAHALRGQLLGRLGNQADAGCGVPRGGAV